MTAANPPSGTVTFLFTDIEGSTRLWDQFPDAMADAMETHDALLQQEIDANNGYAFSQAGDGWGISFGSPLSAARTALSIQDRLSVASWTAPIDAIKVRMGLHTGTSVERNGDYFGTAVNRSARVSAVGGGGQILVTDTVHSLLADEKDEQWRFRDLGEHRLQDLVRSERIWQLDKTGAQSAIADIARRTVHGNLPPARTNVFGRDEDVDGLVKQITNECLVTLVGVGGVGKTTLAQSAARKISDSFPAGAWFVNLAGVTDPGAVVQTVATALDITQRSGMTTTESIVDALAAEPRLIVIDNAEHVIGPVVELVDTILDKASHTRLIVTSREPLAINGEVIQRVHPLVVRSESGASPAIDLFIERAMRVAPDLDSGSFDRRIVGKICEQLDGLPLAIELAASQCETMLPAEVFAALADNSLTLRSTSRSSTERHRSLSDLVSWSYERLEPREQIVFSRLAVFSGGCTADAARFVCADDQLDGEQIASALRTLTRKSMIITERLGGTTRFTMLETLRRFSEGRFDEASDRHDIEARHAEWFSNLSASASVGMSGPNESRHLALILADLDNLRKASRRASDSLQFDIMSNIAASLPHLVSSKIRPGMLDFAYEALDVLPSQHNARLDYAFAIAHETLFAGDLDRSVEVFRSATADVEDRTTADAMLGSFRQISRFFLGDLEFVLQDAPSAIAKMNDAGLVRLAGTVAVDYALALTYTGNTADALEISAGLTRQADESGNPTLIGWARYLQGELNADVDPTGAMDALEESVEYSVSVDNEFVTGISLIALAATAGRHGDTKLALDAMERSIHLFWGLGNRPQLWTAVRNLVEILHSSGMDVEALTLDAAAEADAGHAPEMVGPVGDRYRKMMTEIAHSLGSESATSAAEKGHRLEYNESVEFALDSISRTTSSSA